MSGQKTRYITMLRSLALYAEYFIKTAFLPERSMLLSDVRTGLSGARNGHMGGSILTEQKEEALSLGIGWLLYAQSTGHDGGMGSYHTTRGWGASYPETTGYIIPTLLRYSKITGSPDVRNAAVKAGEFLLQIQKPSGGWQGGRVNEKKPEIVFNTGQVIRGMIALYEETGKDQYLQSAVRAGKWLCSIQYPEGYWKTHALMNQARVYDAFVDAPLLELHQITGEPALKEAATRNLDWIVDHRMLENGWFQDCDNTVKHNDRPILHTIAYTLEGLTDSGLLLGEPKYTAAAAPGARVLRDLFLSNGRLHGRYDRDWKGDEHFICTGGAQMSSVWMKHFRISGDDLYLEAARRMNGMLVSIQRSDSPRRRNTLGAIPGSYPMWGRYEPFAFPNWATKFFCDALMMELEMTAAHE